jgi:hypothetical protein
MAMQALTVRGIEALKPKAKRYEVFDAWTPARDPRDAERTQILGAPLSTSGTAASIARNIAGARSPSPSNHGAGLG